MLPLPAKSGGPAPGTPTCAGLPSSASVNYTGNSAFFNHFINVGFPPQFMLIQDFFGGGNIWGLYMTGNTTSMQLIAASSSSVPGTGAYLVNGAIVGNTVDVGRLRQTSGVFDPNVFGNNYRLTAYSIGFSVPSDCVFAQTVTSFTGDGTGNRLIDTGINPVFALIRDGSGSFFQFGFTMLTNNSALQLLFANGATIGGSLAFDPAGVVSGTSINVGLLHADTTFKNIFDANFNSDPYTITAYGIVSTGNVNCKAAQDIAYTGDGTNNRLVYIAMTPGMVLDRDLVGGNNAFGFFVAVNSTALQIVGVNDGEPGSSNTANFAVQSSGVNVGFLHANAGITFVFDANFNTDPYNMTAYGTHCDPQENLVIVTVTVTITTTITTSTTNTIQHSIPGTDFNFTELLYLIAFVAALLGAAFVAWRKHNPEQGQL